MLVFTLRIRKVMKNLSKVLGGSERYRFKKKKKGLDWRRRRNQQRRRGLSCKHLRIKIIIKKAEAPWTSQIWTLLSMVKVKWWMLQSWIQTNLENSKPIKSSIVFWTKIWQRLSNRMFFPLPKKELNRTRKNLKEETWIVLNLQVMEILLIQGQL